MNANQTLIAACSALATTFASSSAAFASAGGTTNKVFVSGPLVLLFLGFCALVVVIQCIPAIIMLFSMIKGAASKKVKATANAKYN